MPQPYAAKTLISCTLALLLSACAGSHYQPQSLSGQVSLAQPLKLARDSTMVHLVLLDVSGSGGGAALLAEQFLAKPAQFPLGFDLRYDQSAISANDHYQLNAQVYSEGELLLQGTQALTALPHGLPATQNIEVRALGQ